MTKTEKILRQQVKDLERSLEIKEAVIKELKDIVSNNYTYRWYTNPWSTQPYYNGTITTIAGEDYTYSTDLTSLKVK